MMSLQETNPDQAAFFLGLFDKAVNAYAKEDYVCATTWILKWSGSALSLAGNLNGWG